MKHLLDKKQKVVLWTGLFVALSAAGILLSCRSPETDSLVPMPARVQTATVRDGAGQKESGQSMKKKVLSLERTAGQTAELVPVVVQTADQNTRGRGYEMPFSTKEPVTPGKLTTETDPARLCAALAEAMACGNFQDVAVLRAKLLDIGVSAVPAISTLLNVGVTSTEIEAVRLLVQIGGEEALASALGKMMTIPVTHADYQSYLAAFANARNKAVAMWLANYLGWVQTDEMRQRTLTILGALRGREVIESLVEQFASPADQMHSEDCVYMLVRLSDPEQVEVLSSLLLLGGSADLQDLAAYGLASVGSSEACEILLEHGSSSEAGALASCDALATVSSSYGQETLIQAAVDQAAPSVVRRSAVQALSAQGGQRIRTVLSNLGQSTSDLDLQAAICKALQQLAKQSGTPPHYGGAAAVAVKSGEMCF